MKEFKVQRIVGIILICVAVVIIPIIFNEIFHGSSSSYFWFFESSMSVSEWFSFWISYISLIVSSILAYAALKLTKTVEYNNILGQIDNNISLLKITELNTDLELCDKDKTNYSLEIKMPLDVLTVSNLTIKTARIEFEDGTIFNFNPQNMDNKNQTNIFLLIPKFDKNDEKSVKELNKNTKEFLKWKYWESQLNSGYETINLTVTYQYIVPSFVRNSHNFICQTEVIYKLKSKSTQNFAIETIETATIKKQLSLRKKGKK